MARMLGLLRKWVDQRVIERFPCDEDQWQAAFDALPLLRGLGESDRDRLRRLAILFMHRKFFEGAHGMMITRETARV